MPTLMWVRHPEGGTSDASTAGSNGSEAPVPEGAVSDSAVSDPAASGVALPTVSSQQYASEMAEKKSKPTSERKLPPGVYSVPSGKFEAQKRWGGKHFGKKRYIGTFDTPEQACASFIFVKKYLAGAKPSKLGADEVNALFDEAKQKAVEIYGGVVAPKRVLPTGVTKSSSRKFQAMISWGDKQHYIGSFDTPEQASAAYQSVKKDLAGAKPSKLGADEVLALFDAMVFDAAKKKAIEAVGGANPRKRKPKASSQELSEGTPARELPRGVRKTRNEKFETKTRWNCKDRYIGTFDTSEQASAAYVSVKKDLAGFKPSTLSTDETDAIFDAAQKKAIEAIRGGLFPRKKKSKVSSDVSPGTDATAPPFERPMMSSPPPSKNTGASPILLPTSSMQHRKTDGAATAVTVTIRPGTISRSIAPAGTGMGRGVPNPNPALAALAEYRAQQAQHAQHGLATGASAMMPYM